VSNRKNAIGFSQRVRLEWLERTANLVLAGNDRSSINEALQGLLEDKVSVGGLAKRGNREKIITILLKVWLAAPPELEDLRGRGLDLLQRMPRQDHIAVHWGMIMAVYPFWSAVARQVGRLLRLQGTAAAAHVQRRVREEYGERDTVSRAARRILRTYLDWGVLQDTSEKGVYSAGSTVAIGDDRLIVWLVEAYLQSQNGGSAPIREVLDNPSLFPFRIKPITGEKMASLSPNLDMLRHGLDDELVMLKKR
jgi:hypothetical protein